MKIISKEIYESLKSWPFLEAGRIIERFGGIKNFKKPDKNFILFETGYGPSGLPHIGTFAEVVRTTMVKNAFENIVDCQTKLVTFSDDMDGLRKVPENVPNQELLKSFIGKPLTSIPDPFEKYESFGHHNNEKLKFFLEQFGFKYEFISSTEKYKSGYFDKTLINILQNYDKILSIILPTLRAERQKTYSPFLPISPVNGHVLQVKIDEYRPKSNSIIFVDPANNKQTELEVTKGNCKLQWKVDWAMRWIALDVNYEMCGKDLTESVDLASKICKILKKEPPINLIYEMFLDEKGEKISKSIGNGISVDQWLRYASQESLSLFMFQKPKSAKKLYFDSIPKSVDEYFSFLKSYHEQNLNKLDNPVWHIHQGQPPKYTSEINFNSLLNLVSVCNSQDKEVIWGFLKEYDNTLDITKNFEIDKLIQFAINYYVDFVLPNKEYIKIDSENKKIFEDILNTLKNINQNVSSEEIQTLIYEIGKKYNFSNLRDYFKLIYQVLLGQKQGPRLGSFIKLYGIKKTCNLIEKILRE
ncbi:MAG: Lysine--tRNA ligase [Alphaproteobacteria bacterium MarineAlpha5_Bin8]|nr:MAG: Lysine--tRNA ligase [Alphaproteobacteria bacterium MarineAlpha5_Bin8]PPR45627.1 MAG: Lysine--tRNA ligase [Alphaproteobacteria bacterium MarineAlpha5_Bin7]PPR54325.1 MAG: Lysine--tRNA ligase [Alphaproteobacteria bacterium MarineAlpha5_Bin6]|tara:strand:+ start:826 stop:2409 length:1584 start_codon:yes stop_codon:yes gene_type:complete